jgi:hypothetical protein
MSVLPILKILPHHADNFNRVKKKDHISATFLQEKGTARNKYARVMNPSIGVRRKK